MLLVLCRLLKLQPQNPFLSCLLKLLLMLLSIMMAPMCRQGTIPGGPQVVTIGHELMGFRLDLLWHRYASIGMRQQLEEQEIMVALSFDSFHS